MDLHGLPIICWQLFFSLTNTDSLPSLPMVPMNGAHLDLQDPDSTFHFTTSGEGENVGLINVCCFSVSSSIHL